MYRAISYANAVGGGGDESTTMQAIIEMLDEAVDEFITAENIDKTAVVDQLQKILSKVQLKIEYDHQVVQIKS